MTGNPRRVWSRFPQRQRQIASDDAAASAMARAISATSGISNDVAREIPQIPHRTTEKRTPVAAANGSALRLTTALGRANDWPSRTINPAQKAIAASMKRLNSKRLIALLYQP